MGTETIHFAAVALPLTLMLCMNRFIHYKCPIEKATLKLCVKPLIYCEHNFKFIHIVDDGNRSIQPIPMPGDLPYAYIHACREIPWSVECLTCHKAISTRAEAQPHLTKKHQVIATCDQTPVSVFTSEL